MSERARKVVTSSRRVHRESPGICYEWARADGKRTIAIHISFGRPVWWLPNVGRKRYSGITEWRVGWLLCAFQLAYRGERR